MNYDLITPESIIAWLENEIETNPDSLIDVEACETWVTNRIVKEFLNLGSDDEVNAGYSIVTYSPNGSWVSEGEKQFSICKEYSNFNQLIGYSSETVDGKLFLSPQTILDEFRSYLKNSINYKPEASIV